MNLTDIEAAVLADAELASVRAWPMAPYGVVCAHRALLLAEVKRLRELCGRAAPAVTTESAVSYESDEREYWAAIAAELREASLERLEAFVVTVREAARDYDASGLREALAELDKETK